MEANRQLGDDTCYELLLCDPTQDILKCIKTKTDKWYTLGLISQTEKAFLYIPYPTMPTLYLLPKIYKGTYPPSGRPIIAGINSACAKLGEYIDKKLQVLMNEIPSFIQDTKDSLSKLQDIAWEPDFTLVCIDLVSLYTAIEHRNGITATQRSLWTQSANLLETNKMILEMLEFCLENNVFSFNGKIYRQKRRTAMGAKFAPPYACIFMSHVEKFWLWDQDFAEFTSHIIWRRFIDDILCIWQGDAKLLQRFLEKLDKNPWGIKTTHKYSKKEVHFLDVTLYVKDNTLQSELFRKDTAANSILRADSCHPRHNIRNIPKGEFLRTRRNCSEDEVFEKQGQEIITRLSERGYDRNALAKTLTSVTPNGKETNVSTKMSTGEPYYDTLYYGLP